MFPRTPVPISAEDQDFLLHQEQVVSGYHKNIAYRPQKDRVTGLASKRISGESDAGKVEARLRAIMRKYSQEVEDFLTHFLAPYKSRWRKDFASYRPQEEEGRDLAIRKRNDLLHTDAFPTRPTNGDRILRFFNNIHPSRTRDWITTDTFDVLVTRMRQRHPDFFAVVPNGADRPAGDPRGVTIPKSMAQHPVRRALSSIGLGSLLSTLWRSPYDEFMLHFHHYLKENEHFQKSCAKQNWQFPPGSSWMVYTDMVSHAVLSGRYALEQTFIIAKEAMVTPKKSPYDILAALTLARE